MAFTFGNPNLFVKGMVDATVRDVVTGDIVGYDSVSSENACTTSMNLAPIEGGFTNQLLLNIPDTTRVSGTLTSQAFSLEQRARITGSAVTYGGIIPVTETVTATAPAQLYVSGTPVADYGADAPYGYIREKGATSYTGKALAFTGSEIMDAAIQNGRTYEVTYFVSSPSAKMLPLPTSFAPGVYHLTLKYGVYSKQMGSEKYGTLYGFLYLIVPYVQFTGDAGVSGNQTTNSTTSWDWQAVNPDGTIIDPFAGNSCDMSFGNYAYYVFSPCGDIAQEVSYLSLVGGQTVSLKTNGTPVTLPFVYVMKDGSVLVPQVSDVVVTIGTASNLVNLTGWTISAKSGATSSDSAALEVASKLNVPVNLGTEVSAAGIVVKFV